uniref:Uncharacterized protein n=1 Tax=Anguilla anguilla TaxID=7936 RepID=A0A0E9WNF3_ANGAN
MRSCPFTCNILCKHECADQPCHQFE